jgi:hypothetical protein
MARRGILTDTSEEAQQLIRKATPLHLEDLRQAR